MLDFIASLSSSLKDINTKVTVKDTPCFEKQFALQISLNKEPFLFLNEPNKSFNLTVSIVFLYLRMAGNQNLLYDIQYTKSPLEFQ